MKVNLRWAASLAGLLLSVSIIGGLAAAAGPAPAAPSPALNPKARRDYRIRNVDPNVKDDPGSKRMWSYTEYSMWEEPGTFEGKPARMLHREDRSPKGDRAVWEFIVAPDLKPYRVSRKVYTRQNKMVDEQTETFANHFYRFPPRTVHGMMTVWTLEHIDLTIGKRSDYWITLGSEMEPWQMYLTPEAEETVTVPAGTFKCVRVRVEYSTDNLPGFFRMMPKFLIKQIVSGYTGWVTKDTHVMVKFQGKLEGLGSPDKVQELMRIR